MGLRPLPSALASQKHEGSAPFEGGARSVQSKLLILLEGSEGGAQMELEERCLRRRKGVGCLSRGAPVLDIAFYTKGMSALHATGREGDVRRCPALHRRCPGDVRAAAGRVRSIVPIAKGYSRISQTFFDCASQPRGARFQRAGRWCSASGWEVNHENSVHSSVVNDCRVLPLVPQQSKVFTLKPRRKLSLSLKARSWTAQRFHRMARYLPRRCRRRAVSGSAAAQGRARKSLL